MAGLAATNGSWTNRYRLYGLSRLSLARLFGLRSRRLDRSAPQPLRFTGVVVACDEHAFIPPPEYGQAWVILTPAPTSMTAAIDNHPDPRVEPEDDEETTT